MCFSSLPASAPVPRPRRCPIPARPAAPRPSQRTPRLVPVPELRLSRFLQSLPAAFGLVATILTAAPRRSPSASAASPSTSSPTTRSRTSSRAVSAPPPRSPSSPPSPSAPSTSTRPTSATPPRSRSGSTASHATAARPTTSTSPRPSYLRRFLVLATTPTPTPVPASAPSRGSTPTALPSPAPASACAGRTTLLEASTRPPAASLPRSRSQPPPRRRLHMRIPASRTTPRIATIPPSPPTARPTGTPPTTPQRSPLPARRRLRTTALRRRRLRPRRPRRTGTLPPTRPARPLRPPPIRPTTLARRRPRRRTAHTTTSTGRTRATARRRARRSRAARASRRSPRATSGTARAAGPAGAGAEGREGRQAAARPRLLRPRPCRARAPPCFRLHLLSWLWLACMCMLSAPAVSAAILTRLLSVDSLSLRLCSRSSRPPPLAPCLFPVCFARVYDTVSRVSISWAISWFSPLSSSQRSSLRMSAPSPPHPATTVRCPESRRIRIHTFVLYRL